VEESLKWPPSECGLRHRQGMAPLVDYQNHFSLLDIEIGIDHLLSKDTAAAGHKGQGCVGYDQPLLGHFHLMHSYSPGMIGVPFEILSFPFEVLLDLKIA
jgi:hypothetical protein